MSRTHAQLLELIDNTRISELSGPCYDCGDCEVDPETCRDRCAVIGAVVFNAHLDTLKAIVELHGPFTDAIGLEQCQHCSMAGPYWSWPCKNVEIALEALRKMGAL